MMVSSMAVNRGSPRGDEDRRRDTWRGGSAQWKGISLLSVVATRGYDQQRQQQYNNVFIVIMIINAAATIIRPPPPPFSLLTFD